MESEGSDPGNSSGEDGCGGILKLIYTDAAVMVWLIGGVPGTSLRGQIPPTHASHEFPESDPSDSW